MLEVRGISASYGKHRALDNVSLQVKPGEIVVILGANGAGKSTLLRSITGICEGHVDGTATLDGAPLTGRSADRIVEAGIAFVPEGRGIFGDLTVEENLLLGSYVPRARDRESENMDRVLRLFPKLLDRRTQIARTMSGGEQQMVAIGRAMMSNPKILLLDEPSLGLSPLLCKELFQNLRAVKDLGIGVLMVEQNARQSLAIADRGYLLENAQIIQEASASALMNDPAVKVAYLGGKGSETPGAAVTATDPVAPAAQPPRPSAGEPRRTADQQIGTSISDIVERAAQTSAAATNARPKVSAATVDRVVGSRAETILKDIEAAAAAARNLPPRPSRSRPKAAAPENLAAPPTDQTVPVIEVYRRPRVAVYRRGEDGSFEET